MFKKSLKSEVEILCDAWMGAHNKRLEASQAHFNTNSSRTKKKLDKAFTAEATAFDAYVAVSPVVPATQTER